MTKKHTYLTIYSATRTKPLEPRVMYDTNNNDMYFLKDLTNNEFIRIPWSNPTQRDLQAFIKGYCYGIGKTVEFEKITIERNY